MARNKYSMQKPVQNDLQQCINSFERMKRGGIGIADECVEDTCKRALKYIDELEDKLDKSEPVRHGHWGDTTKPYPYYDYKCSVCGYEEYPQIDSHGECVLMKYCPNCGAKMDGDKNDS